MNSNEQFELHSLGPYQALKVVFPPNMTNHQNMNSSSMSSEGSKNHTEPEESGSGSGSGSGFEMESVNGTSSSSRPLENNMQMVQPTDCFLGFSDDAKPACYDSIHHREVLLQIATVSPFSA